MPPTPWWWTQPRPSAPFSSAEPWRAGNALRLTDAAIARLRPREREYTLWDSRVPGLGVRVRPTGARTFVMLRHAGGESRRVSLGPISTMGIAEARKECLVRQAVPERDRETAPKRAVPLLREFIEGEWKNAHFDQYKPSTRKGVPLPTLRPHPAGIRIEEARPYDRCTTRPLVRRL